MTSLEYYIEQVEQFISALTDDIESGEGTVVTQTKLAVYREVLEHLEEIEQESSGDLISREGTLTAFADYVGSGMSMNDYDALWDIVAKMPTVKQEPKFIAKSDGTIEQIKNCDDCLFKKEWEKIGKLISVVLEKQTEQEPSYNSIKTELNGDMISRQAVLDKKELVELEDGQSFYCINPEDVETLPSLTPQPKTGHWIVDRNDSRRWDKVRFYCSECGEWQTYGKTDYCPSCGVKMVEPQERSGE